MDVKSTLIKNDFKFQKRYGQNFITDKNFLVSVVDKSGVTADDTVVEIGAGAGTLTAALASKAKKVIAYEIDGHLKPVLEETLGEFDNVEIVFGDFMKSGDVSERVAENYKVVANLPYYITTPVLFKLIEETSVKPLSISVMVQKEVADRLCAKEGSKDYGALTVTAGAFYEAKKIIDVNRTMFYPVPNVDSAVVLMTRREGGAPENPALFSRVVRAAFAMRRKMLVNNLMASFALPRETCEKVLEGCGLSITVRGEALSREEFVALATSLRGVVR
ncbi:MAG: ribosomal RNA small subunit methyltransferase A [Clostridia bacterium]|nr:ribosomal RNA small subunit methyltransferase A [Clostridia bacterium]